MELVVFVVVAVAIGGIGVAIGMLLAPRITSLAEREDDQHAADDGDGARGARDAGGPPGTDHSEDEPQRDDRA